MIYFNSDNLKAYYANTLIMRVYLGDNLIYGDNPSGGGFINITSDGQGLILKQGYPIEYEDYTTGNRETAPLEADIDIPNLTQPVFGTGFYWSPPSMVNTTYGSYIKPDTAGWTSKSQYQTAFESATGWTDTIFLGYPYLSGKAWELSGSYYVPSTSISGSQGDSIPSPSYGSAVNRNNLFVVASMFQISGLDTSADYSISTQNYISSIGLSNVTYNSPHVYLIDATNNEVVKTQTASSMLGTTVYISATYRPKTTTTVFLVCYAWESIRQTYSGSTQYPKPVLSSGYPKVGVRKLSYTYNYNKVFTLSLDAYKFDPELPVEVQMFATEGNESYGVPIARYKVNENNVVYDLQLVT